MAVVPESESRLQPVIDLPPQPMPTSMLNSKEILQRILSRRDLLDDGLYYWIPAFAGMTHIKIWPYALQPISAQKAWML